MCHLWFLVTHISIWSFAKSNNKSKVAKYQFYEEHFLNKVFKQQLFTAAMQKSHIKSSISITK